MTTHGDSAPESGLAHGQLCYLQLPALDIRRSADFYEAIFGWRTDPANSGFDAPGLIGQWVDDRPASPGGNTIGLVQLGPR